LIVDAVYLGGVAKNAADDPLNILTRCGNMGGFRKVGRKQQTKYVVLYSSQSDQDWPDRLDTATGLFTHYGDNKTPGSGLHPELPGQSGTARQVGVKETARLISRLRHRQFGILVTTSYIGPQAYREIREDSHPVILLCGRDIARLLVDKGYTSVEAVGRWLRQFPR